MLGRGGWVGLEAGRCGVVLAVMGFSGFEGSSDGSAEEA